MRIQQLLCCYLSVSRGHHDFKSYCHPDGLKLINQSISLPLLLPLPCPPLLLYSVQAEQLHQGALALLVFVTANSDGELNILFAV